MPVPLRVRSVLPCLLLFALAPSCATFHGLNDSVTIEISSNPTDAEVCVLDETLWYSAGKQRFEQMLAKGRWDPWFDTYRRSEGRTPVKLRIPQSVEHLVLHAGDHFVHREYTAAAEKPEPGANRKLLLVLAKAEVAR